MLFTSEDTAWVAILFANVVHQSMQLFGMSPAFRAGSAHNLNASVPECKSS